jgi:anti-sigma factor RsiW
MSDEERPVTANDLHAYADGQLPAGDVARVEQWLADHPEDRAIVLAWQTQNGEIRRMFAPYQRSLPNDTTLLNLAQTPASRPVAGPLGAGRGRYLLVCRRCSDRALDPLNGKGRNTAGITA